MLTKYESLFILATSVKEEALDSVIESITAEITKLGGSIQQIDKLGHKTFARPMKKAEHGNYVKIRFDLDGQQVAALRLRFKHSDEILRLQIVTRNERIEEAKARDDERRARFKASLEASQPAAQATESFADDLDLDGEDDGDGNDAY